VFAKPSVVISLETFGNDENDGIQVVPARWITDMSHSLLSNGYAGLGQVDANCVQTPLREEQDVISL
jgi:hypothetical protein